MFFVRSAHTRKPVVGTCMLQRPFNSCDIPVFVKRKDLLRDQNFHPRNFCTEQWNSCAIKQGENSLNYQCCLQSCVLALALQNDTCGKGLIDPLHIHLVAYKVHSDT